MSLSYRLLRSFRTVARHGSITAASAELHVSQPALTQTVQQLEDIVGTPLLNRTARGVILTAAGREFLMAAEQLIDQMDRTLDDIRGYAELRRGSLTVAALPSVAAGFMPRLIGSFKKQYPNLHVNIFDTLNEQIEELVTRGLSDMGLTVATIKDPQFESRIVASDRMMLICEPTHPLAQQTEVTWKQAAQHEFVGLSRQSSTRRIVEQAFAAAGQYINPVLEVQHVSAVGRMVEAGLGITIVPQLSAPLISDAKLVWRPMTKPTVGRKLRLIRPANRTMTPAAKAFWEHVLANQHVFEPGTAS